MSSVAMTKQTAGAGAARAVARRRARQAKGKGGAGANRRPGWVTYAILAFVLLASAYPLYYSFLLGSSDAQTIAQNPVPSMIPAEHFFNNVKRARLVASPSMLPLSPIPQLCDGLSDFCFFLPLAVLFFWQFPLHSQSEVNSAFSRSLIFFLRACPFAFSPSCFAAPFTF